jgi:hypothetical protein
VHATSTSPARKRRKVASNGDHVALAAPLPAEQSVSEDVEPSSTTSQPASNVEKVKSSVRTQTAQLGKRKRNTTKYVLSGDESTGTAETLRSKRKEMNGISAGRGSPPEHETANPKDVSMPSDTQKKHPRKEKTMIPAIPAGR